MVREAANAVAVRSVEHLDEGVHCGQSNALEVDMDSQSRQEVGMVDVHKGQVDLVLVRSGAVVLATELAHSEMHAEVERRHERADVNELARLEAPMHIHREARGAQQTGRPVTVQTDFEVYPSFEPEMVRTEGFSCQCGTYDTDRAPLQVHLVHLHPWAQV